MINIFTALQTFCKIRYLSIPPGCKNLRIATQWWLCIHCRDGIWWQNKRTLQNQRLGVTALKWKLSRILSSSFFSFNNFDIIRETESCWCTMFSSWFFCVRHVPTKWFIWYQWRAMARLIGPARVQDFFLPLLPNYARVDQKPISTVTANKLSEWD